MGSSGWMPLRAVNRLRPSPTADRPSPSKEPDQTGMLRATDDAGSRLRRRGTRYCPEWPAQWVALWHSRSAPRSGSSAAQGRKGDPAAVARMLRVGSIRADRFGSGRSSNPGSAGWFAALPPGRPTDMTLLCGVCAACIEPAGSSWLAGIPIFDRACWRCLLRL